MMLKKLFTASIVALIIFGSATHAHAKPMSTQAIAYCIEAGIDDGQTDEEIKDRCVPAGEEISDYYEE